MDFMSQESMFNQIWSRYTNTVRNPRDSEIDFESAKGSCNTAPIQNLVEIFKKSL